MPTKNRPSIEDRRPGNSFIEYMVKQGYDAQCDRPGRPYLAAMPIGEHHDEGQQPESALAEGERRPYWYDGGQWRDEAHWPQIDAWLAARSN
jgi:hypothetical protein